MEYSCMRDCSLLVEGTDALIQSDSSKKKIQYVFSVKTIFCLNLPMVLRYSDVLLYNNEDQLQVPR